MKTRMLTLLMIALLCLTLVPAAFAEDTYGVIQGGSLHMRSNPSEDSAVVETYDSGTWVEILEDAGNGFYHVVADDGREGYMASQYIIEDTLGAGDWGTVENGDRYVNLRSGPSTQDSIIGRYYTGDRFELLSYGEVFSQVRFDGNVVGYMSSGLIRLDDETVWKEEYIHTAQGGKLNLRSGPSTKAGVLGSYEDGAEIIVLIQGKLWDKVFIDGAFGYMDAEYLATSKLEQQTARHQATSERRHQAEGTLPFSGQPQDEPEATMAPQGDPLVLSFDGSDFTPNTTFQGPGADVDDSQSDG